MLRGIGTSLIILVLPLLCFGQLPDREDATAEADDWTRPILTLQQRLSRTSIMVQLLGSSITPSLAAEYSIVKQEKVSFDIRGSMFAVPLEGGPFFSFSLGPQIQYGRRTGRLIGGMGFGTFFSYGKEFISPGQFSDPKVKNQMTYQYLMLGYRAQHQHGFFFEIDALMVVSDQFGFNLGSAKRNIFPWGGLIFGYRMSSRLMRDQRKAEGKPGPEERAAIKAAAKQTRDLEKKDRRMRMRVRSRFYLEGLGVAPWTLNYEYTVPLHRSGIPMLSLRTGIGYTSSLSIPIGVGIGGMKNGHGGFLVGGMAILYDGGAGASFYFGANFQVHAGKGITVGFAGYGLVNPHWGREQLFSVTGRGIAPMAGITLGYRLQKFTE